MSDKTLFCVSGEVKGFPRPIKEYVYAYSAAQAKKLVAQRLKRRYPHMRIYLGNCFVEVVEKEEVAKETEPQPESGSICGQQKLF